MKVVIWATRRLRFSGVPVPIQSVANLVERSAQAFEIGRTARGVAPMLFRLGECCHEFCGLVLLGRGTLAFDRFHLMQAAIRQETLVLALAHIVCMVVPKKNSHVSVF